ncbi:MAG: glucose-6-phosphate dehydrogenase, partial [Burkholderiales bacterium]|nr:glucose-6-phosphate dehydrogenase [Burkholderiales bacterium]
MVLFGGTGDLVMRKLLPALYHQHQEGNLPQEGRIVCLGRSVPDTAAYLKKAHALAVGYLGSHYNDADWATFAERIEYLHLDANHPAEFTKLADALNTFPKRVRVFYLSTAPDLFAPISKSLSEVGLAAGNARVVLEKPLGHDLASSNKINDEVGEYFQEHQIYRIDHYLGKEPVQNLMALRFANTLLEPLWRREWIRDVQITVTEQVGVESRADFYDKTGALRDMVQNHLLQLLTIVAMEPPASIDADAVRDEKLKILRALKPLSTEDVHTKVVRGQYRAGAVAGKPVPGYLNEPDVPAGSKTETFVALKVEIQTWRWAGVPFYLRTGKRLSDRLAEIVINFRETPHSIYGRTASTP